jgi:hypothetical protein
MTTKANVPDPRTEAQQEADEAAAVGNRAGFETEELLTEDAAVELLKQRDGVPAGAPSVCQQPFRWRAQVYRILRCEFLADQPVVEVAPKDDEFAAEIKRRLVADRFHHLAYCQGFGFACFPEDYENYQE